MEQSLFFQTIDEAVRNARFSHPRLVPDGNGIAKRYDKVVVGLDRLSGFNRRGGGDVE
ncbi:hypothetical protein D3C81_1915280 [compost metagenome]